MAQLDEPLELNYVRKHVLQQIEQDACDLDDAAVRVFSNAPGNYGTNVNFMVMDSQWEREETLGDLFVTRKCFAYGRDSKGTCDRGQGSARRDGPRALARRSDVPEHRHVRDRADGRGSLLRVSRWRVEGGGEAREGAAGDLFV